MATPKMVLLNASSGRIPKNPPGPGIVPRDKEAGIRADTVGNLRLSCLRKQQGPSFSDAQLRIVDAPSARRADWSRRRNPPLDGNEEAGYGFAYNPPYELISEQIGTGWARRQCPF